MKRLVLHWTGGGPRPSPLDLRSYHALVAQDCERYEGDKPPEANRSPLGSDYVRHAGGFNSDSIGLALCGMNGARERPFHAGGYPINAAQYEEAAKWAAEFCETYDISVSRNTILLHSEVRPRFGRGVYKWDVNWLPGMERPGDPVEMGDSFRARVVAHLETMQQQPKPAPWVAWWRRWAA